MLEKQRGGGIPATREGLREIYKVLSVINFAGAVTLGLDYKQIKGEGLKERTRAGRLWRCNGLHLRQYNYEQGWGRKRKADSRMNQ